MSWRRMGAALAATTLALILLPTQALASAKTSEPDRPHGRLLGTLQNQGGQHVIESANTQRVSSTAEKCTPTAPGSVERRSGAARICTSLAPASAKSARAATASRADLAAPSQVCTITDPGYWHFERLSVCLREMKVLFTLRGEQQQVVGSANLYVSSSATLNPRSGTWDEDLVVEAVDFTGQLTSVSVGIEVSCDSLCTATNKSPWIGNRALTNLGVATGRVSYSDAPAVGKEDRATVNYRMTMFQTGTAPATLPAVEWSNPRAIRCDSVLTGGSNTSTGCALPSVTPEMELPLATYGAAAATYQWAQYTLSDGWGLYSGKPLTRALDGSERRRYTCGDKTTLPFVPKPDSVPNDTCDEFPFASTHEGGTDGALCAEIVPLFENGVWQIYEADPARPVKGSEPCVRGHVPSSENSAAGGAYSAFIQNQRLVDKDPFHVSVAF